MVLFGDGEFTGIFRPDLLDVAVNEDRVGDAAVAITCLNLAESAETVDKGRQRVVAVRRRGIGKVVKTAQSCFVGDRRGGAYNHVNEDRDRRAGVIKY